MTKIIKNTVLGLVAAGLTALPSMAQMVVNQGDLILTVYQNKGGSAGYGEMTYNVNLGLAQNFKSLDPAESLINIAAALNATFGGGDAGYNWAEDDTLRFMLLGGYASIGGGDDPSRTSYVGSALSGILDSSTQVNVTAPVYGGFTNSVSEYSTGVNAAVMSFDDLLKAYLGTLSSYSGITAQSFDDGSDYAVAFDLYRYTGTTGLPPTMGTPTNLGTLTIDSLGNIGWNAQAVPEPSTYLLLGLSCATVVIFRRRKQQQ